MSAFQLGIDLAEFLSDLIDRAVWAALDCEASSTCI